MNANKELTEENKTLERKMFFESCKSDNEDPITYDPTSHYSKEDIGTFVNVPEPGTLINTKYIIVFVYPKMHHLYLSDKNGELRLLPTGLH